MFIRPDLLKQIDDLMKPWGPRLRDDLNVSVQASTRLASSIAAEVAELPLSMRESLLGVAGSGVTWQDRHEMLGAFQLFMEMVTTQPQHPVIGNIALIVQNYMAFVYLGDALFTKLRKAVTADTTTRKCATFLTDNPVRAFRNAVAHGNWRVRGDLTGLEFWARKGSEKDEPMSQFHVTIDELDYWQALARATAYACYLAVDKPPPCTSAETNLG